MSKVAVGVIGGALAMAVALSFLVREEIPVFPATSSMASSGATHVPNRAPQSTTSETEAGTPPQLATAIDPAGAQAVTTPMPSMPIRPEFEPVFRENPILAYVHSAMAAEPRDEVWAAGMEDSYKRAFASNIDLNRYGVPSAECRSTRCEIQMLAYGAPEMAREQWGNLLGKGLMDAPAVNVDSSVGAIPTNFWFGSKVVEGTTALVFHVSFARPR